MGAHPPTAFLMELYAMDKITFNFEKVGDKIRTECTDSDVATDADLIRIAVYCIIQLGSSTRPNGMSLEQAIQTTEEYIYKSRTENVHRDV